MSAVAEAARAAMTKCLAVQAEDYVLVVTDETCQEIGLTFRDVAQSLEAETLFLQYRSREHHGDEPPIGVAEIMREMDVVLAPTKMSISHTDARRRACKAGARIATLPGVTPEMLERCFGGDIDAVAARVREIARAMQGRAEVHVTDEDGSDLRFSMDGARVFQDTGMIRQPGDFGTLPPGKAAVAPVEGSARGDIVIRGTMFGRKLEDEPLRLRIEGGRVVGVEGGEAAARLNSVFEAFGDDARTLSEFGLGAHDHAILTGNPLEDEKVQGTMYLAFGNNRSLGGSIEVAVHEVAVLTDNKVTLDGRTLLENGVLSL